MNNPTEKAKQAIDEMFSDASVPQYVTRNHLRDIIEHCEVLIDTLDEEDLD